MSTAFDIGAYLPIAVMFVVAAGFAASQILVTQLIGPRKRTATKLMPYECGKDPVGSAHDRFSVKFYMVGVAFLLFDIEVLFLIPFAVAFKSILGENVSYGTIAFVEVMIFIATLIAGLVYIWKKGVFDWSLQARSEARAEARTLIAANKRARTMQQEKRAA
ncbi:MAG TPA: NADH-quinone oxidoreductase subunit A [Pyrinomonadaceae bacterium]|nr:NADH-quinone oxidoreductase subunit A [Pyrinomonadaceae bacterium]